MITKLPRKERAKIDLQFKFRVQGELNRILESPITREELTKIALNSQVLTGENNALLWHLSQMSGVPQLELANLLLAESLGLMLNEQKRFLKDSSAERSSSAERAEN